jgi:hypothetical protein
MFNAPTTTKQQGVAVQGNTQSSELAEFIGHLPKAKISKELQGKLQVLYAAFANVGSSAEHKYATLALYAQFSTEFPEEVGLFAADWLLRNNPRNASNFTQPPSAQDFREACREIEGIWSDRVAGHYDPTSSQKWGRGHYGSKTRDIPWGTEPMTSGCAIPDGFVLWALRKFVNDPFTLLKLLDMKEEDYRRLPASSFDGDLKVRIDAARADPAVRSAMEWNWMATYAG